MVAEQYRRAYLPGVIQSLTLNMTKGVGDSILTHHHTDPFFL